MFKTIHRLKPGGSWRIGELESWLSHMSEKGWHLKGIDGRLAKFTKGEPKKIKYRVEVSSKTEFLSDEQIEMYKEFGWIYIDNWFNDGFRRSYVFSSLEELNAPELHTDPAEQSFTLKDLNRNLRDSIILNSLLIASGLFMSYGIFFSNDTPYRNLVQYGTLASFLPFLLMFYFFIGIIRNWLSIKKLKKQLSEGKFINHKANWKPALFFTRCNAAAYLMLTLFLVLYANKVSTTQASTELPISNSSTPIVFLNEIDDNFTRYDSDYNKLYSHESIFTSVNYYTMENGKLSSKTNKNEVYKSSLSNIVYKVHFENMVPKVVEDMVFLSNRKYIKTTNEDFDLLYINKAAEGFNIIASRGHGIIELHYTGNVSLENILSALSSKLELIK